MKKVLLLSVLILLSVFSTFGQKSKIVKKTKSPKKKAIAGRTVEQMRTILQKLSVEDNFVYKYDKFKDESTIGFQSSIKQINTQFKSKYSLIYYKIYSVFIFNGKTLNKPPLNYYFCLQTDSRKFYFENSYISAWALADENRISFGKADSNMDLTEKPTVNENLELDIRYIYKPCWVVKYKDFAKLGEATDVEFKVDSLEFQANYDDLQLFNAIWLISKF